ncbi:aspartyl/glutamyl-tRNA amidotransferase subunit A [Spiroplasma sabaudiense Ar-1343]|uniref:Aspartyl/glutamyl-tRNA amidotransferase subunit A n=1 Tax=Spiroplasma sabaudiense Ar-1343 TaxID=1276257 RepID=W6A972_9MOLU|nr:amidase family protein [Spiroplasma sabaudiense]AHI53521.1 aspartyl/glutamyl-tRNA amidotransferase subunit A [Spiroplasma sabaudiense Ar-1343]
MKYENLSIEQLHELLKNKKFTVTELTQAVLKNAKKYSNENFLVTSCDELALKNAKKLDNNFELDNLLFGIPYMMKDNLATKGIKTTASSKILSNFIPTYNATVFDSLNQVQSIMIGKTALDELGMGGTGLLAATGIITNPRNSKHQVGGSSSGSAWAVAKGIVPFATGTDTGDSIRKPASYNGIVGYKPTYGAISRFGLLPYAPSLDHVGFFTRNVNDMAILADASISLDSKDLTSMPIAEKDFFKNLNNFNSKNKFGYIIEIHEALPKDLKTAYDNFFKKLREAGVSVEGVHFKKELLQTIPSVYMMISFSEAVSQSSNLNGINFTNRIDGKDYAEIMTKTRSQLFGPIVKRRFLVGSFQLKRENQELLLEKAKKVRRLIAQELKKIYNEIDILILPPAIDVAPKIDTKKILDLEDNADDDLEFINDILILANFNGMPSITIPFIEKNNLPIGINFSCAPLKDQKLLQAAKFVENIIGIKDRIAGDNHE